MRQYIDKLGHRPRIGVWELTLACNASCLHCASRAGRPRDHELDTEQALHLARELVDVGCRRVTFSGGEPLLRRDWPRIAGTLSAAGVTVGLISNGLLFDADAARHARDTGLEGVAFSVDGPEAVHDRIRGRAGGFRKTMAAFDAAAAAGVPTSAVTHANRWNIDRLDELRELLVARGVRSWKVQLCNPGGEASAHREMILQPRDLLRLVPQLVRLKRQGAPFVEASDSIGYFGPYEKMLRESWRDELPFWTGCYAGCRSVGIESDGGVKGCLALPSARNGTDDYLEGNVLDGGLAAIWARPGAFAYNREFHPRLLTGFCRTCPYGEICRAGCHWTALAQGGTLYENRYCYYRVSLEEEAARPAPRPWFVRALAPAAIVAALGVTSCYQSYQELADGRGDAADARPDLPPPADDGRDDAARDAEVPHTPDGAACPDPCEGGIDYVGPPPIPPGCPYVCDSTELCPTDPCCDCEYMGPIIPPGCVNPC